MMPARPTTVFDEQLSSLPCCVSNFRNLASWIRQTWLGESSNVIFLLDRVRPWHLAYSPGVSTINVRFLVDVPWKSWFTRIGTRCHRRRIMTRISPRRICRIELTLVIWEICIYNFFLTQILPVLARLNPLGLTSVVCGLGFVWGICMQICGAPIGIRILLWKKLPWNRVLMVKHLGPRF